MARRRRLTRAVILIAERLRMFPSVEGRPYSRFQMQVKAGIAELLIDSEEDKALRAVFVGMLRESQRR